MLGRGYEELQLAAKKGAVLLDERAPGWEQTINLAILDVFYGCACPLGQVFGGFSAGMSALGQEPLNSEFASEHGFAGNDGAEFKGLNMAWREQVLARR